MTQAGTTLAEYLQASYRPECEYIDGRLRQKPIGDRAGARLRARLCGWLGRHESQWGVIGALRWRVRVSEHRVRVPDLVLTAAGPQPEVLVDAPLLVVEILSPDATFPYTMERADDYLRMGANSIWVIDPKTRTGRMCDGGVWRAAERLVVPGTAIYANLPELFAAMTPGTPKEKTP